MNHIGKIIVHFDDSGDSEYRLKLARQVAHMQVPSGGLPSAVEVVYVTLPDYLTAYSTFAAFSAGSIDVLVEADTQRAQEARARFDQWVQGPSSGVTWISAINEMPQNYLLSRAWFADLIVLGQNNPDDSSKSKIPQNLIADLIIDSGKPCLIVPYIGVSRSTLKNIMVAWKFTRESSNALTAAIPFMQNASSLHIVADIPPANLQAFSLEFTNHLASNGVAVKPTFRSNAGIDLEGNDLLSIASDVGADLLVMGCYGHSRTREFVLGGVSRTVLKTMTLPVLMLH